MDLTVKNWPGLGANEELGRRTIWLGMDQAHTPTWCANCQLNMLGGPLRGLPAMVDLSDR